MATIPLHIFYPVYGSKIGCPPGSYHVDISLGLNWSKETFTLKNTFIHIPGIGIKTEERLWDSGILDWYDFIEPFEINLSHKLDGNRHGTENG